MTLSDYQLDVSKQRTHTDDNVIIYPILTLVDASSSVAGTLSTVIRDNNGVIGMEQNLTLAKNLAEVFFQATLLASDLGIDLEHLVSLREKAL